MAGPENQQQQIQLPPNSLQALDYASTKHDALIPQGVQPEELLKPEFWAHHGVKLRPWDEIRARAEDGTWLAYYVVLDCSRTWAKVHQLALHRLTTGDVAMTQASEAEVRAFVKAHEVRFNQGQKWHVVRKLDRQVVQEQIAEKDAAIAWLDKHARGQVGAPTVAAKPEAVAA